MSRKTIIPLAFIILLFVINIAQASIPLYINYEITRIKPINFTNTNLLEKKVNDVIEINFFDEHILNCEVKRINDMYQIRQIRCAPECWPIQSFSQECIQVRGESEYFVFTVSLDAFYIIDGIASVGNKDYQIKTCLGEKEIYSRHHNPNLSKDIYSHILIENNVKNNFEESQAHTNPCKEFQQNQTMKILINETVKNIKCVFNNSKTQQWCSPSIKGTGCMGTTSCDAKINYYDSNFPEYNITSDKGKEILWNSSCGNFSMIIGNHGADQEIIFNCEQESEKTNLFQKIIEWFKNFL